MRSRCISRGRVKSAWHKRALSWKSFGLMVLNARPRSAHVSNRIAPIQKCILFWEGVSWNLGEMSAIHFSYNIFCFVALSGPCVFGSVALRFESVGGRWASDNLCLGVLLHLFDGELRRHVAETRRQHPSIAPAPDAAPRLGTKKKNRATGFLAQRAPAGVALQARTCRWIPALGCEKREKNSR